jgi:DNA repair exonuclease SbcCD ATPase subunit
MITLTKLCWSNLFSYGEDNEIDFTKNPLTQIVGANGHGKSSIALILEEVLYNKNSKGIKKADILNRNLKAKSYSIELEFFKDDTHYLIKTTRGTTQTVKLYENGTDISSHTATGTYATIQSLIVYDHKTFSQIVYQSSASSLEFLTATDGNRKKFLIDLLNLTKYIDIGEIFKDVAKDLNNKVIATNTKIKSAQDWIDKYSNTSLDELPIQGVPEQPRDLIELVSNLKEQILTIDVTNKKIAQNNKYKEIRDGITLNANITKPLDNITEYSARKAVLQKVITDENKFVSKMKVLGKQCPTCLQDIDTNKLNELVEEHNITAKVAAEELKVIEDFITKYIEKDQAWLKEQRVIEEYEKYHNLFDPKLQQDLISVEDLESQINEHEVTIKKVNDKIREITDRNNKAVAHNAKIEVIKNQLIEMNDTLIANKAELESLNKQNNTFQILIKTFSPTGLVAYKIECLIKDLELLTNEYLAELSSGRFQLAFKISSDKLNVVITDNGKDVEIYALSSGERARVNAAALLGIRKLMQSLSNSRINLLILDETIENLDIEGKEKLVEVLLSEEFLNTFVISHSFSHPLLERIYVTKTNNISRIENG